MKESHSVSKVLSDALVFAKRFVTKPRQIGSITPSSRFLTSAMLERVQWPSVRSVAELGAGTGVFTREIVKRLPAGASLLVFELDPALRRRIEKELGIKCHSDASDLPELAGENSIDVVISSLPWTVLPPRVTAKIIDGVLSCLKPEGQFLAYQYSRQMMPAFRRRFESVNVKFVMRNIPPAFVYDCRGKEK